MPCRIETQDLVLRPFRLEDTKTIFQLSQEASLGAWIPDQVYADEAEAEEVLRFLISQYAEPVNPSEKPLVVALEDRRTGEVVGHVGLSPLTDGTVEIGFAMAEKRCGKGYATQAVTAMSEWARAHLPIPAILGVVACENGGSARVLEKAGYRLQEESDRDYLGKVRRCRTYQFSR